jgi:MoxR-like ATPase
MKDMFQFLSEQGGSEALLADVKKFRRKYRLDDAVADRVIKPYFFYYGKEIWEMAIAALFQGENVLLSGPKATGKNVLSDNLAYLFHRPSFNVSFNVNTDSATLVGTDTFENNAVTLRKGPVYLCALYGGFGIFDEINMAKNDAVSVLHSTLDHRRIIDIPGYEKIVLHDATRFIGTMNYGYAGTKELNEALVSRFLVIDMPPADEETLLKIMTDTFPDAKPEALVQFAGLFLDLQLKAMNAEISTKPLDLRGLLAALRTVRAGLLPAAAVRMGITNKSFDSFEKEIIEDIVLTRIPADWTEHDVFA